jgi:hypothetical protein
MQAAGWQLRVMNVAFAMYVRVCLATDFVAKVAERAL